MLNHLNKNFDSKDVTNKSLSYVFKNYFNFNPIDYINDNYNVNNTNSYNKFKSYYNNFLDIKKISSFSESKNKKEALINNNCLLSDNVYNVLLSLDYLNSNLVSFILIDYYTYILNRYIMYVKCNNKSVLKKFKNNIYFFNTNFFNLIQSGKYNQIIDDYIDIKYLLDNYECFVIPIIYDDKINTNRNNNINNTNNNTSNICTNFSFKFFVAKFEVNNRRIVLYDPSSYLIINILVGMNIIIINYF